jgi:hypothetical protein
VVCGSELSCWNFGLSCRRRCQLLGRIGPKFLDRNATMVIAVG